MRKKRQEAAAVLTAVGLLVLGAGTPVLADDDAFTGEMREAVESLRDGSMTPAEASASCLGALEAGGKTRSYREFMSTFLNVPDDEAVAVLCRATVQGIADGSISEAQLGPALDPTGDDGEAVEFGRLLRAIFFSHRMSAADGGAQ